MVSDNRDVELAGRRGWCEDQLIIQAPMRIAGHRATAKISAIEVQVVETRCRDTHADRTGLRRQGDGVRKHHILVWPPGFRPDPAAPDKSRIALRLARCLGAD